MLIQLRADSLYLWSTLTEVIRLAMLTHIEIRALVLLLHQIHIVLRLIIHIILRRGWPPIARIIWLMTILISSFGVIRLRPSYAWAIVQSILFSMIFWLWGFSGQIFGKWHRFIRMHILEVLSFIFHFRIGILWHGLLLILRHDMGLHLNYLLGCIVIDQRLEDVVLITILLAFELWLLKILIVLMPRRFLHLSMCRFLH